MKKTREVDKYYEFGNQVVIDFEVLNRNHKDLVASFRCGNDHIDDFVRKKSYKDKETITYAAIDASKNKIISIFTIVCSGIYTSPSILSKRESTVIPAIEIKNFATDEHYQHIPYSEKKEDMSLSYQIFNKYKADLIELSKTTIGAKKIILYSVPEAVKFYKTHKFIEFKKYMVRDERREIRNCIPLFFSLN